MTEARFYRATEDGVECQLCPHHCHIREGGRGLCRSRECRGGKLYALSYGTPCALAIDPVEKKPLNEFMSGTECLSLSCTGCNLSCRWCQNKGLWSWHYAEDGCGYHKGRKRSMAEIRAKYGSTTFRRGASTESDALPA